MAIISGTMTNDFPRPYEDTLRKWTCQVQQTCFQVNECRIFPPLRSIGIHFFGLRPALRLFTKSCLGIVITKWKESLSWYGAKITLATQIITNILKFQRCLTAWVHPRQKEWALYLSPTSHPLPSTARIVIPPLWKRWGCFEIVIWLPGGLVCKPCPSPRWEIPRWQWAING